MFNTLWKFLLAQIRRRDFESHRILQRADRCMVVGITNIYLVACNPWPPSLVVPTNATVGGNQINFQ